jgi:hypothetical protein
VAYFGSRALHTSILCGTLLLSFLLGGCAQRQQAAGTAVPLRVKQGSVRGGQQAVTGATIQLYAVGTAGDGSASTPLLTPAM